MFIIKEPQILGDPRHGVKWKGAVVIQGPLGRITPIAIGKFLAEQGVLVIVSTTHQKDQYTFSEDERRAVSDGVLVFLFVPVPDPTESPHFFATNHLNKNFQRLTSYYGVNYAHRLGIEYCLKIRSDVVVSRPNMIDFLKENVDSVPVIPKPGQLSLKGRMVICGYWTVEEPFPGFPPLHVCDFWRFGHTEDLLKYFDITSSSSWNGGEGCVRLDAVETTFSKIWLRDMKIEGIQYTREITGRYLVPILPWEIEQEWFRGHSHEVVPWTPTSQSPKWRTTSEQWKSYITRALREERKFRATQQ